MTAHYKWMLLLPMILSCSTDRKNSDYRSSVILHNSMMEKALYIERDLTALWNDTLPAEMLDSLQLIEKHLIDWKGEVVEVPGNDRHDHQSHAHERSRAALEATPEQMLQIQEALDTQLSIIGKRLARIKSQLNNRTDHRTHQHRQP